MNGPGSLERIATDFIIIGSGAAGLRAALDLADVGKVLILTKTEIRESNSRYAQGGIAAAIGQEDSATLHFSAFDRSTPVVKGEVTKVSADIFTDQRTGHAYYRADIALDDHVLAELEGRRLVPGMPVEAFIATSDRTALGYFVKPLADFFNRAFRER